MVRWVIFIWNGCKTRIYSQDCLLSLPRVALAFALPLAQLVRIARPPIHCPFILAIAISASCTTQWHTGRLYNYCSFQQCKLNILLLLSEHTPLEHCCVHNMSPFVSSSGLSSGSREAKVQRAKGCLNCTEPSAARSSCCSLPVGRYLSDTRCKGSMVVLVT